MDFPPFSRIQIAKHETADPDSQQSQRGMADGSSHAADLAVFSFRKFDGNPTVGHMVSNTDRRIAGWDLRLRVEHFDETGTAGVILNGDTGGKPVKGFR